MPCVNITEFRNVLSSAIFSADSLLKLDGTDSTRVGFQCKKGRNGLEINLYPCCCCMTVDTCCSRYTWHPPLIHITARSSVVTLSEEVWRWERILSRIRDHCHQEKCIAGLSDYNRRWTHRYIHYQTIGSSFSTRRTTYRFIAVTHTRKVGIYSSWYIPILSNHQIVQPIFVILFMYLSNLEWNDHAYHSLWYHSLLRLVYSLPDCYLWQLSRY